MAHVTENKLHIDSSVIMLISQHYNMMTCKEHQNILYKFIQQQRDTQELECF